MTVQQYNLLRSGKCVSLSYCYLVWLNIPVSQAVTFPVTGFWAYAGVNSLNWISLNKPAWQRRSWFCNIGPTRSEVNVCGVSRKRRKTDWKLANRYNMYPLWLEFILLFKNQIMHKYHNDVKYSKSFFFLNCSVTQCKVQRGSLFTLSPHLVHSPFTLISCCL